MATDAHKQALEAIRAELEGLKSVYLFGSRATGEQRHCSDWDIGVVGVDVFDPVLVWEAAQRVAVVLDCDVDLVDLRTASTVLRFQIVAYGKRLFSDGLVDTEQFDNLCIAEYLRFAEARRELVQSTMEEIVRHAHDR